MLVADISLYIDGYFFRGAEGCEFPVLQHGEDLGLHRQGQVPDFIQEDRAAVGYLDMPCFIFKGIRKGALFVAEEFAFKKAFGQGCQVNRYKYFGAP